MRFGDKVRDLRKAKKLTQRDLAGRVKVCFTYISKIENGKLDFGDYPSDGLIRRLARALSANLDEMLLLAERIPEPIRKRVMQRPVAFRRFAALNDRQIDQLLRTLDE